jgi:hypothetical protein
MNDKRIVSSSGAHSCMVVIRKAIQIQIINLFDTGRELVCNDTFMFTLNIYNEDYNNGYNDIPELNRLTIFL